MYKTGLIDTVFKMTVDKTAFDMTQDGVRTGLTRRGQLMCQF